MGWYDIFKTGEPGDHFFQFEEGRSAGIALVSQHHSCPLTVTHGTRTGVGNKVDVYLFGFQLKYIVVRLFYPLLAFLTGTFTDRLYHLDFP